VDERSLLQRLGRTEVNEEGELNIANQYCQSPASAKNLPNFPTLPTAVTWFDELCFRFGIELDGIEEPEEGKSGRKYKIDIGANRYDLLCIEGIARSLNAFLGREQVPLYKGIVPKKDPVKIIVDPSTKGVRPFVVGAVLRGVTVTEVGN